MHVLLLLLSAFLFASATTSEIQRIIGGVSVNIQQYPFMGNIEKLNNYLYWTQECGSILLTSKTLMTAAHCVHNQIPNTLRIRLGSSRNTFGGQVFNIEQIKLHEDFDHVTREHDLAILRMTNNVALSSTVNIARIAGGNYILADNTAVTKVGFGDTGPVPINIESDLYAATVTTINQEYCRQIYKELQQSTPFHSNIREVTNNMMCAGVLGDIHDSCLGDHGGPVIHGQDIVYGVMSWAYGCGDPRYPGVSILVPRYQTWIVENASI